MDHQSAAENFERWEALKTEGEVLSGYIPIFSQVYARQLAEKVYALYGKFRPEIPPGKKGGAPPASWTWTSSARWLRPDPEERLFGYL